MANPKPIHALRKQAASYNSSVRKSILNPLYRAIRAGVTEAYAARELLHRLDANTWTSPSTYEIAQKEASVAMTRLRNYHTDRLISTFEQALGVDIRPVLAEPAIQAWMHQAISQNVDLIVTIPPRFHQGLKSRIEKALQTSPFDRANLNDLLQKQYGASGYQLRRLTRDQTTKAIGNLTHIRHDQLGIKQYIWRTSLDGRVRPTHLDNEGRTFSWASPPMETGHPGHDIQCRCTAQPIIG